MKKSILICCALLIVIVLTGCSRHPCNGIRALFFGNSKYCSPSNEVYGWQKEWNNRTYQKTFDSRTNCQEWATKTANELQIPVGCAQSCAWYEDWEWGIDISTLECSTQEEFIPQITAAPTIDINWEDFDECPL